MHPSIRAQRTAAALARAAVAAERLGARFGFPEAAAAIAALPPGVRQPEDRHLYRLEAMASLLEMVTNATAPGVDVPDDSDRLGVMTVGEAAEHIASVDDLVVLDRLAAGERMGKGRKGVMNAIDARRDELATQEAEPAPAFPSFAGVEHDAPARGME